MRKAVLGCEQTLRIRSIHIVDGERGSRHDTEHPIAEGGNFSMGLRGQWTEMPWSNTPPFLALMMNLVPVRYRPNQVHEHPAMTRSPPPVDFHGAVTAPRIAIPYPTPILIRRDGRREQAGDRLKGLLIKLLVQGVLMGTAQAPGEHRVLAPFPWTPSWCSCLQLAVGAVLVAKLGSRRPPRRMTAPHPTVAELLLSGHCAPPIGQYRRTAHVDAAGASSFWSSSVYRRLIARVSRCARGSPPAAERIGNFCATTTGQQLVARSHRRVASAERQVPGATSRQYEREWSESCVRAQQRRTAPRRREGLRTKLPALEGHGDETDRRRHSAQCPLGYSAPFARQ
jgi:hypothetical protein